MLEQAVQIGSTIVAGAIGLYAAYILVNGARKLLSGPTDDDGQEEDIANAWRFSNKKLPPLKCTSLRVVRNEEDCRSAVAELREQCNELPVLALDCESNTGDERRKVALLQLASLQGMIVLIRLCKMDRIPPELNDLLFDENVLKVGDEVKQNLEYLKEDYQLMGRSASDLAPLANGCYTQPPFALEDLAKKAFDITINWRQGPSSDWEAGELSTAQIKSAAMDVRIAIELFRHYADILLPRSSRTSVKVWMHTVVRMILRIESEGNRARGIIPVARRI